MKERRQRRRQGVGHLVGAVLLVPGRQGLEHLEDVGAQPLEPGRLLGRADDPELERRELARMAAMRATDWVRSLLNAMMSISTLGAPSIRYVRPPCVISPTWQAAQLIPSIREDRPDFATAAVMTDRQVIRAVGIVEEPEAAQALQEGPAGRRALQGAGPGEREDLAAEREVIEVATLRGAPAVRARSAGLGSPRPRRRRGNQQREQDRGQSRKLRGNMRRRPLPIG